MVSGGSVSGGFWGGGFVLGLVVAGVGLNEAAVGLFGFVFFAEPRF